MKFETTYKGFKIEFDSYFGKYTAYDKDGDIIKETTTETKVKEYLDSYVRGKKKINIPIIQGINYREVSIKFGKITSIVSYNRDDKVSEVWINVNGDRRKEYIDRIYADTPENREKMNEIIEILRKINILSKEREEIEKTLTHPEIQVDEEA